VSVVERDEARSQLQSRDDLQDPALSHVVDKIADTCRIYHPDEIDNADDGQWLQSDLHASREAMR
jgi:hypothetical protein